MVQAKDCLKKLILILALSAPILGEASGVKIKNVDLQKQGKSNRVTIDLGEELTGVPELQVRPNIIQLEIPGSYVWPQIEKKVSLGGDEYDSTLKAYQFTKDVVRFRAVVPFNAEKIKDQVSVTHNGDKIQLVFPHGVNIAASSASKKDSGKESEKSAQANAKNYDESYLNQLLKEKKEASSGGEGDAVNNDFAEDSEGKGELNESKDEVNVTLSGEQKSTAGKEKDSKSSFSIMSYVGKFVAFLALVLVFFYGVVSLLKKGVFKRGKLTLFNDTNVIEVLNTTYLGPKKSLMLVKAHKQVFLVASTEKGFEFLSEIKDTSGLFKEGEKQIAGDNFDTNLDSASQKNKEFNFKDEDQQQSLASFLTESREQEQTTQDTHEAGASKTSGVKDQVKLSDQIKSKMKDLKQLQ